MKFRLVAIFGLLLGAFVTSHVSATPLTYSFTATLGGGYWHNGWGPGARANGTIVFDPDSQPVTDTDGSTLLWQQKLSGQYFGTPYSAPYVYFTLNLPNGVTLTNSGVFASQSETSVVRNRDRMNRLSFDVSAKNETVSNDLQTYQNYFAAHISLYDLSGAESALFTDPNGGLRYDQSIDLFAARQEAEFSYVDMDPSGAYRTHYQDLMRIDSLVLSQVPEPSLLVLLLTGLTLLAFRRATGRSSR